MKKDTTLVILAAGMGSRFGGLKQIEPLGPNGEFLIDYSIFDAIKVGFTKIVFIIKEENYEIFKETIGKRVESHIKVEYCFQNNDNLPDGYEELKTREKPLGTAHAILCCKDKVKEPFAIINADDFYGRDAFVKAHEFLSETHKSDKEVYGLIGYLVKNTINETGAVKRGVCEVKDNKLTKIIESSIEIVNGDIIATPLGEEKSEIIDENTMISLNMILFNPSIFKFLEQKFPEFLKDSKKNVEKCEFLIPTVLFDCIKENFATVDVINTTAVWQGVTYREDVKKVKSELKKLVDNNEYNNNLWN